jgi:uncharacterized protein
VENSRVPTPSLVNPIIEAAQFGQAALVQGLIKQGYNVNGTDCHGISPALVAAKRNDFEMLKVLAAAGAKLGAEDLVGETPLFWAQYHKNRDMVEFIEEQSRVVETTPFKK